MKTLILLGCLFYTGLMGYWIVKKLDVFLSHGGVRPHWDEEDEEMSGSVRRAQSEWEEEDSWEPEKQHIPWASVRIHRS